ncbi:MAG: protein kinase [Gemmatimonadota bacterium]
MSNGNLDRFTAALADRYHIERELGSGGMATVYLAHDLRHNRRIAIKVLRPELAAVIGADRFLKEITTTANLQHPHILGLIDSGETEGMLWYAMPYVDGESLRDRLTREKQLPVADAVRIATEVAGALDYAHRHGVIHRDIKPENILLHDGSALVADFGIALAASSAGTRMTETGMSLGTPHYMSPEQAMGEREITARSDVYALGCITYEMLVGEPPFTGPTAQAIIARVMTDDPRSLTGQRRTIPPNVEAAVFTALQKLPADRFATAAEFSAALTSQASTATWTTGHGAAAPRAAGWRRLAPWGVAIAALAVGAWGWMQRAPKAETRWYPITLSDTLGINSFGPALAISPDGRTIVFRDAQQNGLLWMKRANQIELVPIPGTERSTAPAFSPDGQWLAFAADRQLKKVRLDGGTPILLADSTAPSAYGIAWLDNTSLIYASPTGDQFRRIAASGGSYTTVLVDSTLRGYGFLNPTPLPNGRGVLFLLCTSGCATTSIQALDFKTGTHREVLKNAFQAWYLPTGDLLYTRTDGAVLTAPFDLDRLELSGPPITRLTNVSVNNVGNGLPMLAWSASGTLLYFTGEGTSGALQPVRVSRSGTATPIDSGWFGAFNSFALSANGQQLAVGAGQSTGGLDIWIKQLDHGPFSRFTFGGQDRRPAWSPDGQTVAFIRDSINGGGVYLRAANGSGVERSVARFDRPIQEVTWTHDGQWLVVRTDNGGAGLGDLLAVRATGDTTPVVLVNSPFTELHPAVSPDSRWLAYASDESGINEVYVRPFPATSAGRWQVSSSGGMSPVWSPDGRTLYYLSGDGQLVAVSLRSGDAFDVESRESLFDARALFVDLFHTSFAVSPDNRSFIFLRRRITGPAIAENHAILVENWFATFKPAAKQ